MSGSPPHHADRPSNGPNGSEAVSAIGEALRPEDENTNNTASSSSPSWRPSMPTIAPPPPPQATPSFSRPLPPLPANYRQRGATRKMSKGGGVQMVLEETGSWSELADQSSTLPAEGYEDLLNKGEKPPNSGMLAFLNRKKGRERSPKPTEPGVLGKEGARHIISS
jgi:serine/threonine kinase 32